MTLHIYEPLPRLGFCQAESRSARQCWRYDAGAFTYNGVAVKLCRQHSKADGVEAAP